MCFTYTFIVIVFIFRCFAVGRAVSSIFRLIFLSVMSHTHTLTWCCLAIKMVRHNSISCVWAVSSYQNCFYMPQCWCWLWNWLHNFSDVLNSTLTIFLYFVDNNGFTKQISMASCIRARVCSYFIGLIHLMTNHTFPPCWNANQYAPNHGPTGLMPWQCIN